MPTSDEGLNMFYGKKFLYYRKILPQNIIEKIGYQVDIFSLLQSIV